MSRMVAAAAALESQLRAGGVVAHVDVRSAAASLPCVLIPPATIDGNTYGGPTYTWRLIVLAADTLGSLHSFEQLSELLDQLDDLLPVERAEPIAYALPALGGDPLPAFAVTVTGS